MRILAVLLLVSIPARAEFFTGNELLSRMDSESLVDRSMALGYVVGVSDMGDGYVHCPPTGVTTGQVRDIVRSYLVRNPSERHMTGDILVNKALKAVWPCKRT